jgi:hypothetical protein
MAHGFANSLLALNCPRFLLGLGEVGSAGRRRLHEAGMNRASLAVAREAIESMGEKDRQIAAGRL